LLSEPLHVEVEGLPIRSSSTLCRRTLLESLQADLAAVESGEGEPLPSELLSEEGLLVDSEKLLESLLFLPSSEEESSPS
jgi:hypothetical protein